MIYALLFLNLCLVIFCIILYIKNKELKNKTSTKPDVPKTSTCSPSAFPPLPIFILPTLFSSKKLADKNRNQRMKTHCLGYELKRAYSIWTPEEDILLLVEYDIKKLSIQEIARIHQRTPSAIKQSLKRLGRII